MGLGWANLVKLDRKDNKKWLETGCKRDHWFEINAVLLLSTE